MSGLNQVVLIGNLTRDPELRYTPDGTPVTSFTIAVNRPFINRQGEREADFVPVVVWKKQAETCSEYLMKGSQVAVEGRLQVRNYEDKDGIRKWVTEVVARRVDFLQRLKKQFPSQISEEENQNEIDRVPLVEEKKGNDTPSDK